MNTTLENLLPTGPYHPAPLFGPMTRQIPAEYYFLPMWHAVETLALPKLEPYRDRFLPGALSSFRDDFLSTAGSIWQAAVGIVAEKLAGPLPRNWKQWLEKTLLPLLENGQLYHALASEYPVFERQAVLFIRDAAAHLAWFVKAVSLNHEAILSLVPSRPAHGTLRIVRVHSVGSDRHNHGQSVHILEYESGIRLVWKPQSMQIDRAWNHWLEWLLSKAGHPMFPAVRSMDLPYGSVCTFLEAYPLGSETAAARYYERAGFLMGAAYLLGGNDCHWENLIACGEYPVLIDTETILYCKNPIGDLREQQRYHVLKTSMLPYTGSGPGLYPGGSALCSAAPDRKNLPCFEGSYLTGYAYPREICDGFTKAVSTCIRYREEAASLAAQLFTGCTFRIVMRPTRYYLTLMLSLGAPASLKDTAGYQNRLSGLENRFSGKLTDDTVRQMLQTEKEALFRLDYPIFHDIVDQRKAEDLKARILSANSHVLSREQEMIRFLLKRHTVREKTIVSPPPVPFSLPLSDMEEMVNRLCRVMEDSMGVMADRNGDLYLSVPMAPMLEGGLGAAAALASWIRIRHHRQAEDIVRRFSYAVSTGRHLLSGGMSAMEPGLCEGSGGCMIGLRFLTDCGQVTKEFLRSFYGRMDELDLLRRYRLYNHEVSLGYGCSGLLFGLQHIPEVELRRFARLSRMKDQLLHSLAETASLSSGQTETEPSEAILRGPEGIRLALGQIRWQDLFPSTPETAVFTDHMALAGGMAGLLMAETARRIEKGASAPSSFEQMCAATLAAAKHPPHPASIGSCGLFWGEAGRIYTLSRFLDPDAVPAIF